jgi:hypothetical protein
MKSIAVWGAAMLSLAATTAVAATFDGKTNLICTVQQLHECGSFDGCRPVDAAVAAPLRHLDVDFAKRSVQLEDIQVGLTSRIATVETIEGKLILQGTDSGLKDSQDGGGWTMAINQRYGSMILTVAGEDVAFVGLGACTTTR